jgi:hypothetical protein
LVAVLATPLTAEVPSSRRPSAPMLSVSTLCDAMLVAVPSVPW